jgi:hypothetical protein
MPPRECRRPQGGELKRNSGAARVDGHGSGRTFEFHAAIEQQLRHYCGFSSRVRMRSVPFMRQRACVAFSAALEGT